MIYDYTVIMAYPFMEDVKRPKRWLSQLVEEAAAYPHGLEKTVFKVQTYDWKRKEWIKTSTLNQWLKTLIASGAFNIAYYPDDYINNHPKEEEIRMMMSVEDFPFIRTK